MKDKILKAFNRKDDDIWVDDLPDIDFDMINSGDGTLCIWDDKSKLGIRIKFKWDVQCVHPYEPPSYWHPGHPEMYETEYEITSVHIYHEECDLGEIINASEDLIIEIIETHTL